MVHVSHRWEFLKASREAGWKTPDEHPDVSPPHEARMLWEQMREIARLDESAGHGSKFLMELKVTERAAVKLERALRAGDTGVADAAYKRVHQSCNNCHANFRD